MLAQKNEIMTCIENQFLRRLDYHLAQEHINESLLLSNCVIEFLDLNSLEFLEDVVIRNCVIHKLVIYSSWFSGGLKFMNNIVLSDIDYQMGGHNKKEIEFSGNIFKGFFSFFDCHFEAKLIIKDNLFVSGSDLFTKENKGFDNTFENGFSVENNIGKLDVFN